MPPLGNAAADRRPCTAVLCLFTQRTARELVQRGTPGGRQLAGACRRYEGMIAMRDPDLVLQARQAAAALERAWQRWRFVHGLAADPIPPVSSYVGYSLEEPWGQPRVVFGLAAEEAERLASLLDRHDCIGPAYASMASVPGGQQIPIRSASLAPPLQIPPQAPPSTAEQQVSEKRRPPRRSDPVDAEAPEFTDLANHWPERSARGRQVLGHDGRAANAIGDVAADQDGPVFRQAAAAYEAAAGTPEAARETATPGDARQDGREHESGPQAPGELSVMYPLAGQYSVPVQRADLDPYQPGSPVAQDGPGPLTQAASAAQVEAEARIKAALHERRSLAGVENPYASPDPDLTEQPRPVDAGTVGAPDTAVRRTGMPRPEAASGAFAWPVRTSPEFGPSQPLDTGSVSADQEQGTTAEIRQPTAVAFRPWPELAAYLDADPESDPFFDRQEDSPAAGFAKRSRMARGHAIPRLPRAKRPGAAPGA